MLGIISLFVCVACGGGTSTGADSAGEGVTGEILSDVPTRASPLHVSAYAAAESALLSWQAAAAATSYTVYWGNSPDVSENDHLISTGNPTSFTHTGLTPDVPYYYRIAAYDNGSRSEMFSEVSAVPYSRAPPGPLSRKL